MMLFRLFLILILLHPLLGLAAPKYNWERIEGCTLAEGWRDGDSFVVKIPPRTLRTFRLYFVDCPEDGADTRFPERVAEQAAYFGLPAERVVKIGDEAAEFTRRVLASKPFVVWTLWQDALGASKKPRFYGMVEVDGRWLSSMLVENGYARIYGKRIQLPDGTSSRDYLNELARLEENAKKLRMGGWSK